MDTNAAETSALLEDARKRGRTEDGAHSKRRSKAEYAAKVAVGGFPHLTSEKELYDFFSCFGRIKELVIKRDKHTQVSRVRACFVGAVAGAGGANFPADRASISRRRATAGSLSAARPRVCFGPGGYGEYCSCGLIVLCACAPALHSSRKVSVLV